MSECLISAYDERQACAECELETLIIGGDGGEFEENSKAQRVLTSLSQCSLMSDVMIYDAC